MYDDLELDLPYCDTCERMFYANGELETFNVPLFDEDYQITDYDPLNFILCEDCKKLYRTHPLIYCMNCGTLGFGETLTPRKVKKLLFSCKYCSPDRNQLNTGKDEISGTQLLHLPQVPFGLAELIFKKLYPT